MQGHRWVGLHDLMESRSEVQGHSVLVHGATGTDTHGLEGSPCTARLIGGQLKALTGRGRATGRPVNRRHVHVQVNHGRLIHIHKGLKAGERGNVCTHEGRARLRHTICILVRDGYRANVVGIGGSRGLGVVRRLPLIDGKGLDLEVLIRRRSTEGSHPVVRRATHEEHGRRRAAVQSHRESTGGRNRPSNTRRGINRVVVVGVNAVDVISCFNDVIPVLILRGEVCRSILNIEGKEAGRGLAGVGKITNNLCRIHRTRFNRPRDVIEGEGRSRRR